MAENYIDEGYNKHLVYNAQDKDNGLGELLSGTSSSSTIGTSSSNTLSNPTTDSVDAEMVLSGELTQPLLFATETYLAMGAATAPLTGAGIWMGYDLATPGVFDFRVGDPAGDYVHWDASASTLTIVGVLTSTSGTIGGFDIGADYVRDAANSFGLASTVTGGDDVRFWAGDTFANRATAPFRVTESGAATMTSVTIAGYAVEAIGTFGGDGSDGALTISSGTTTIDLLNASIVVLNYTSISITGTGKLAFSNPASTGTIIILKSQGAVTLTSATVPCIDASGLGAAGGAGGTASSGGPGAGNNGTAGTTGINIQDDLTTHPGNGATGNGATGGTAGSAYDNLFLYPTNDYQLINKRLVLACGSGGGGGGGAACSGSALSNGGAGGNGGGSLYIECAGALNFTGTVSVAGDDGVDGVDVTGTTINLAGGGGGGGGAGGTCYILYNTLTAASGTINTAGGAGGDGGDVSDSAPSTGGGNANITGAGGGGAGAFGGVGGAGAVGGDSNSDTNGNNGTAGPNARSGGGGGSGANTVYNSSSAYTGGVGGAGGASENNLVAENIIYA